MTRSKIKCEILNINIADPHTHTHSHTHTTNQHLDISREMANQGNQERKMEAHEANTICAIGDSIEYFKRIAYQLNTLSCYQDQDEWWFPLWAKTREQKEACVDTFFKNATKEQKDSFWNNFSPTRKMNEGVSLPDCNHDDLAISDEYKKVLSIMKDDLKHWMTVANQLNIVCGYKDGNGDWSMPHWARERTEEATCVKTFFENADEHQKNEFLIQSEC